MKNKYVQASGGLSQIDIKEFDAVFEKILQNVGEAGVQEMRKFTEPHDWKGNLTNSIMWATSKAKSENTSSEPDIDKPDVANAVDIGSAASYAKYVETGVTPHMSNYKADYFVSNMREWAKDKGGFDPDAEPARFHALLEYIKKKNTIDAPEHPFALPAIAFIQQDAVRLGVQGVMNYWNARAKQWSKL